MDLFCYLQTKSIGNWQILTLTQNVLKHVKRQQAGLSWGSVQAETVKLQLQAKQTTYTNQALSKSNSLGSQ